MLSKIKLYLQLMRIDKPVGFYLLMWPVVWAFLISSNGNPNIFYVIIFALGIIATRSAGCIINDYFDQDFDKKIERTKDRVLAKQKISNQEALILFSLLIIFCFILLLMLNLEILLLAIFSLFLLIMYPLTKRYFKIPQLILGMAFGSSIPMVFILEKGVIDTNCILLYLLTILWAVTYDTYYAMADKVDDKKVGIKSSAIFFGKNDILYSLYLHYSVVFLFLIIGFFNLFAPIYYFFVILSLLNVLYQNLLVRSRKPYQCISAFENNNIFGLIITFGLIFNYL
ncbi:MAG: 4-hydroxybenzoate octaprenyltransferase [Pelagibacterales bacterium]|nr:4-hydroxybenzoate octaprenyltransferase [Pelagibacterales bacterium]